MHHGRHICEVRKDCSCGNYESGPVCHCPEPMATFSCGLSPSPCHEVPLCRADGAGAADAPPMYLDMTRHVALSIPFVTLSIFPAFRQLAPARVSK